jgi:hypothetical protein
MTKRLLLMPGTPKTGTTSIQSFLARNTIKLHELGIEYPLQSTVCNHHVPLVHGLLTEKGSCNHLETLGKLDANVVILNSEHFDIRFSDDLLDVIRLYLLPLFEEVRIALVLRDQLSYAQSSYCESIKWGHTERFEDFFALGHSKGFLNYYLRALKWNSLSDHVTVRLIDYNSSENIILDALDYPDLGLTRRLLNTLEGTGMRLNQSISVDCLLVFRTLWQRLDPEERRKRYLQFQPFAESLYLPDQRSKWRFPESLAHYVDELDKLNKPLLSFGDKCGDFAWANDLWRIFDELSLHPQREIEDIFGEFTAAILSRFAGMS